MSPRVLEISDDERAFYMDVCRLVGVDPHDVPDDDTFTITLRSHYPVSDVAWQEWAPGDLPPQPGVPRFDREAHMDTAVLEQMITDRGLDPEQLHHVNVTSAAP